MSCGCFSVTSQQSWSREPWLPVGRKWLSPLGGEQDSQSPNLILHWGLHETLWARVSLTLSEQQPTAREASDSDNPPCSHLSPAFKTLWQCPMGPLRHVVPGLG